MISQFFRAQVDYSTRKKSKNSSRRSKTTGNSTRKWLSPSSISLATESILTMTILAAFMAYSISMAQKCFLVWFRSKEISEPSLLILAALLLECLIATVKSTSVHLSNHRSPFLSLRSLFYSPQFWLTQQMKTLKPKHRLLPRPHMNSTSSTLMAAESLKDQRSSSSSDQNSQELM